ncbi:hypothetical protein Lal_00002332 [Lupinus albus]|nr:hypothetical protein Lal_00002332 [Lupinus albus]
MYGKNDFENQNQLFLSAAACLENHMQKMLFFKARKLGNKIILELENFIIHDFDSNMHFFIVLVTDLSLLQILICIMLIAPGTFKNAKFAVTWFQNNMLRITTSSPMHRKHEINFQSLIMCGMGLDGKLGVNVACSLCNETMERDILDIHKGENCPQRIVTCEFCEFPLPAIDLAKHQDVCGNRTELCHVCNKYVRLRETYSHGDSCNRIQDNSVGSSRDVRAAERDEGAQRRPQNEFSKRNLLFTIAITGVAVIVGSIFFQRKAEPSDVH